MRVGIYFCFAIFSVFLIRQGLSNECFSKHSITTTEGEILQEITNAIKAKEKFSINCLDLLIKRGYFQAAAYLNDHYFILNQIAVKNDVENTLTTSKRELEHLYKSIMSSDTKIQIIEPVFQWAQSYKYIYIQVKFAHRLDSPGCLSVKNEVVNLTNNTLYLSAFGIQAHQPITFTLNLTLFADIVPENSTWALEAVGTMFFNLTKANGTTLWRRLIVQKEKKIPVWWHMNSEQSVEMREFARMLDDEDEERERMEDKKRKKKKEKKNEKKVEEKEEKKEAEDKKEKDSDDEDFKIDL